MPIPLTQSLKLLEASLTLTLVRALKTANIQVYMIFGGQKRDELSEKGTLSVGKRQLKIVELPLGATEDGLIGTLNAEEAITRGVKVLEPGLLGKANQNILYIDEINLLPDYLIDSILDPAASGWNTVQREGLNLVHPADFTLIASMNPEEGDLRPQILDRFALKVEMETLKEPMQRIEVIRRNLSYLCT